MQAEQVDHRIFGVGRCDGHRLIADVAVSAVFTDGRDTQGIALIAARERGDRLGHRRRKQQGAPSRRCGVEDFLEILAKAHVEHFVGFIEDDGAQRGKVQCAAFQMVAQASGCTHHDMRAAAQCTALLAGVHAADAGRHARAVLVIEPGEFAAYLQRQFARRCDNQRQRRGRGGQVPVAIQQVGGHREAEGHGLARPGLGGNDQVAAMGVGFEHGSLDGCGSGVTAFGQGIAKKRRKFGKGHGSRKSKLSPFTAARMNGPALALGAGCRLDCP